jgi:ABC-2 type transport system permease protein
MADGRATNGASDASLGFADIVAAEWRKTRTARPTAYIVGVTVLFAVLMLLVAVYFVATWDGLSPEGRGRAALGSLPDLMGWITSLTMAVFGALAITTEYSSGMIRTTFLAVPQRGRVLAAKSLVTAAIALVVSEAALAATLVGSVVIIGDRPIAGQAALDGSGLILVVALGLSSTTFAMIGLGLGAITRSALATVVVLAMLWYIVPLISFHLPDPWNAWIGSLLPGALAGELAGTGNTGSVFSGSLPPWAALTAMAVDALAPLAAAVLVVRRRDA